MAYAENVMRIYALCRLAAFCAPYHLRQDAAMSAFERLLRYSPDLFLVPNYIFIRRIARQAVWSTCEDYTRYETLKARLATVKQDVPHDIDHALLLWSAETEYDVSVHAQRLLRGIFSGEYAAHLRRMHRVRSPSIASVQAFLGVSRSTAKAVVDELKNNYAAWRAA